MLPFQPGDSNATKLSNDCCTYYHLSCHLICKTSDISSGQMQWETNLSWHEWDMESFRLVCTSLLSHLLGLSISILNCAVLHGVQIWLGAFLCGTANSPQKELQLRVYRNKGYYVAFMDWWKVLLENVYLFYSPNWELCYVWVSHFKEAFGKNLSCVQ